MELHHVDDLLAVIRPHSAGLSERRIASIAYWIIRCFPRRLLETVKPGTGEADDALRVTQAQVYEMTEAMEPIGPLHHKATRIAVDRSVESVMLLWFRDDEWRCSLRSWQRKSAQVKV